MSHLACDVCTTISSVIGLSDIYIIMLYQPQYVPGIFVSINIAGGIHVSHKVNTALDSAEGVRLLIPASSSMHAVMLHCDTEMSFKLKLHATLA